MEVSWNRGTPKSYIFIVFSRINQPFWEFPIYGNPHILTSNVSWNATTQRQTPRYGGLHEAHELCGGTWGSHCRSARRERSDICWKFKLVDNDNLMDIKIYTHIWYTIMLLGGLVAINFIFPMNIQGLCHHPVIDELHHFSEGWPNHQAAMCFETDLQLVCYILVGLNSC